MSKNKNLFVGLTISSREYLNKHADKTSVRKLAKEEFDKTHISIDDNIGWTYWKWAFDRAAAVMGYEPTVISKGTNNMITDLCGEPDYELQEYTINSRKVEEYVQSIVDAKCAHPTIYLALRYVDTKEPIEETLWNIHDGLVDLDKQQ